MLCSKPCDVVNNNGKRVGFSLLNRILHASHLMIYMFGLKVNFNFKFKLWEGVIEYRKWIQEGPES